MNAFGENLKRLRNEKGMTQDDLAKKLGISRSAVSMYENGDREPDFEMMETIADLFNVDMNYLFGTDNEPEPYDPEVQELIDLLNRDEELKILFMKTGHLENGDRKQLVKVLKALLPNGDE